MQSTHSNTEIIYHRLESILQARSIIFIRPAVAYRAFYTKVSMLLQNIFVALFHTATADTTHDTINDNNKR